MQFYALLALTLAASASARLSQRTLASRDDVDQCAIDCTTKYLVSDAYKNTACDIKKVRANPVLSFHLPLTSP